MGKGEIARNFLHIWRTVSHFHQILNYCLQTLSVWKNLKFIVGKGLNIAKMMIFL